jgi:predicted RNA-binding Zn-ribbon protein involved in translation (DUF1610 family)
VLGDCTYCGDPLTNELASVSCDHCGEGFHVECARDEGEFSVTKNSGLLRSTSYEVHCPNCEEDWSMGFDPRD